MYKEARSRGEEEDWKLCWKMTFPKAVMMKKDVSPTTMSWSFQEEAEGGLECTRMPALKLSTFSPISTDHSFMVGRTTVNSNLMFTSCVEEERGLEDVKDDDDDEVDDEDEEEETAISFENL